MRKFVLAASLPLLALVLFCSVGLHMFSPSGLGGWPEHIGNDGFPDSLLTHSDIMGNVFSATIILAIFVLPLCAILFSLVDKLRPMLKYIGVYYLSCFFLLGCMWVAPRAYTYWFWD